MSIHREKRSKAAKAVIFDYEEVLCHRPTAEEIACAPREGKSPPQSAKDSLCAPWRNDGARVTQSRLPAFKIIQENLCTLAICREGKG